MLEGTLAKGKPTQLRVLKCRGGLPPTHPIALPAASAR
jgi:hypothetical protein